MTQYYNLYTELSIKITRVSKFVERKRCKAHCIDLIQYVKIHLHGKIKFTELNLLQGMST
jgi:hypothetical protein